MSERHQSNVTQCLWCRESHELPFPRGLTKTEREKEILIYCQRFWRARAEAAEVQVAYERERNRLNVAQWGARVEALVTAGDALVGEVDIWSDEEVRLKVAWDAAKGAKCTTD